jgi:hypothetical protein
MRKLFYLVLLCLIGACTDNLVKNPGAETIPLTNEWTIASGRWTQRKKAPLPQEEKAYFFPGVAAHAELFQDIDVGGYSLFTDMGLMKIDFAGYMRVFPQRPPDKSYEVIEFRNADSVVIDSFATSHYDSTKAWVNITHARPLPKATRTIRVRLISDRYNGSNNDGYHDGISVTVSLAWWVYIIVAAIAVAVLWLLLKTKFRRSPTNLPQ